MKVLEHYKHWYTTFISQTMTSSQLVTLRNLEPSTRYKVEVFSRGSNGSSLPSEEIIFLTYYNEGGFNPLCVKVYLSKHKNKSTFSVIAQCSDGAGVWDFTHGKLALIYPKWLTLLMLRLVNSGFGGSILFLLMPWLLKSPEHQQAYGIGCVGQTTCIVVRALIIPSASTKLKGGLLVSPCPSVRLWTESGPLCIFNNSHRIHFIFAHLIKQLEKVCRM